MARTSTLVRLYRMTGEQRRLLLRASFALTAASAAVALLPFRKAIRFGSVPLNDAVKVAADECVWAVEAVAWRLPLRTKCIEKGLAVQRLLRSDGVEAILHYGARRSSDAARLEAHVWVTVGDEAVIGGEEAAAFAEVASFPS